MKPVVAMIVAALPSVAVAQQLSGGAAPGPAPSQLRENAQSDEVPPDPCHAEAIAAAERDGEEEKPRQGPGLAEDAGNAAAQQGGALAGAAVAGPMGAAVGSVVVDHVGGAIKSVLGGGDKKKRKKQQRRAQAKQDARILACYERLAQQQELSGNAAE